jgi:hypothetical protein
MGDGEIEQGAVLWIGPDVCRFPQFPDGFAFRVVDFLGPGGVDHRGVHLVWVRGPVLDSRGLPRRAVQLCVPVDQERAVRAKQAAPDPRYVTGPDGRRYRRTI